MCHSLCMNHASCCLVHSLVSPLLLFLRRLRITYMENSYACVFCSSLTLLLLLRRKRYAKTRLLHQQQENPSWKQQQQEFEFRDSRGKRERETDWLCFLSVSYSHSWSDFLPPLISSHCQMCRLFPPAFNPFSEMRKLLLSLADPFSNTCCGEEWKERRNRSQEYKWQTASTVSSATMWMTRKFFPTFSRDLYITRRATSTTTTVPICILIMITNTQLYVTALISLGESYSIFLLLETIVI